MSFWDNNKDSFKATGIATIKGIGHGTKALGKAGYKTYKNSEAKKKGLKTQEEEEEERETRKVAMPSLPPPNKDLKSYPEPPKRNVPTFDIPSPGEPSAYTQYLKQTQVQQQTQGDIPPSLSSGNRPVPPPPPLRSSNSLPQRYSKHAEILSSSPSEEQPMQPPVSYESPYYTTQQYSVTAESSGYERAGTGLPQPATRKNDFSQHLVASESNSGQVSSAVNSPLENRPNIDGSVISSQNTATSNLEESLSAIPPKQPLPDPTSFAPPPIHKNRGVMNSEIEIASKNATNTSMHNQTQPSNPSKPPAKSNLLNIDVSQFAPPPPIPRHDLDDIKNKTSLPSQKSNSVESQSVLPSNNCSLPPPPPPRSIPSSATSSLPSTPSRALSPQLSSFPPPPKIYMGPSESISSEASAQMPLGQVRLEVNGTILSKKKVPPPKPQKKPTTLNLDNNPLPYAELVSPPKLPSRGISESIPNFAEEIASRKDKTEQIKNKLENTAKPHLLKPKPVLETETIATISKHKPPVLPKKLTNMSNDDYTTTEQKLSDLNSRLEKFGLGRNENKSIPSNPTLKPKPQVKPKPRIGPKPVLQSTKTEEANPTNAVQTTSSSKALRQRTIYSTSSSPPPPPPPPRNYKRPNAPIPTESQGPPDIDLELSTGWFANFKTPLELPKALHSLNYNTSYQESTISAPVGTLATRNRFINVRLRDLSIISYTITWTNDEIDKAESRISNFFPSPITSNKPTKKELITYHRKFGEYIASWCEHKFGQKVGSGECWDLAHDALSKGCGNHAFVSTYIHHGYPILHIVGSEVSGATFVGDVAPLDEIRRGDILQFKSCIFKNNATGKTSTVGSPDHTSVVLENTGDKLIIAEQNVNGVKEVMKGEIILKDIIQGTVISYRAMPAEWAGKF